jgi:sugar lactone lactonase YvrE
LNKPPLARRIVFFLVLGIMGVAVVVVTGVLLYNAFITALNVPRHESKPVTSGARVLPFVSIPDKDVFPMGLAAAPDGTFYLGLYGSGAIKKVSPDGALRSWGQLTAVGALALGPDGALYVIDYTAPTALALGHLKRIAPDGAVAFFGEALNRSGLPLLAQLAFDAAGNLYVSRPDTGEIWRVTPDGAAAPWWNIPPVGEVEAKPVGLAYDQGRNALVVADTGTGTIYRVDLGADVPAGSPLYRQAQLSVNTVAVDDQGRVLVAIWKNDNGLVSRLENDGTLVTLAEKFREPMALLYRDHKVYVVNSDALGLFGKIQANPPFTVDTIDLGGESGG